MKPSSSYPSQRPKHQCLAWKSCTNVETISIISKQKRKNKESVNQSESSVGWSALNVGGIKIEVVILKYCLR